MDTAGSLNCRFNAYTSHSRVHRVVAGLERTDSWQSTWTSVCELLSSVHSVPPRCDVQNFSCTPRLNVHFDLSNASIVKHPCMLTNSRRIVPSVLFLLRVPIVVLEKNFKCCVTRWLLTALSVHWKKCLPDFQKKDAATRVLDKALISISILRLRWRCILNSRH